MGELRWQITVFSLAKWLVADEEEEWQVINNSASFYLVFNEPGPYFYAVNFRCPATRSVSGILIHD